MMMTSPLLLIIAYVCITYAAEPYNCKKYECVEYTLIEKKDKYEIRRYERYNTASHSARELSYQQGKYSNFYPLFRYIKRHRIENTFPVFIGVEMGRPMDHYKMTFFMPKEMTNLPTPMDKNITLGTFGPVTAYVKSFNGWAREDRVFEYQKELRAALIADKVLIDERMFYVAEFNGPYEVVNRHNELIYLAA